MTMEKYALQNKTLLEINCGGNPVFNASTLAINSKPHFLITFQIKVRFSSKF